MSGYSHSSPTRSGEVILARPFKAGNRDEHLKHRVSDAWAIPTLKHSVATRRRIRRGGGTRP